MARRSLLPGYGLSGRALAALTVLALSVEIVVANVVGAAVVLVLLLFVIPLPPATGVDHSAVFYLLAAVAYVAVAVPLGIVLGFRSQLALRRWLREDRPATDAEKRAVLTSPRRLFSLQVTLWFGAAAVFGVLARGLGLLGAFYVALTVALTGITTAATSYLLTERILRPVASRALADGLEEDLRLPGVAVRSVLAWALGSAVPMGGLVAIGVVALSQDFATRESLAVSMVVLGGTGLLVGFLVVHRAARATADPVRGVATALRQVQGGAFDTRIPVYDGTEIGRLQLGFNEMAAGLAERERIREAFGTYVDPTVAEHILSSGTDLAGEEVEVTVLFLDIRDFTGFASRTPAREVVAAVNRLFSLVVPVVHRHGGHVDKFVGDGLLAVFGAPRRTPDHALRALRAALEIERAVSGADPEGMSVGIGLNSGLVVAGNVGGAGRLEFSVIGDAVNVAARVEAATRTTGDTVLLTGRTRELLGDAAPPLVAREGLRLKGKEGATTLYAPVMAEESRR